MNNLISRQEALNIRFSDAINEDGVLYVPLRDLTDGLKALPSAQPEYYDYSDIDDVWAFYAEEQDTNLTGNGKQLKDAMWVGYRKGKQDAQQWIPCSERMPKRNGEYLVWMQWPFDEEPTVSIVNYDADCEMFGDWREYYHPITLGYLDSDFDEIKGVIAWMPLPEPYKEEEA